MTGAAATQVRIRDYLALTKPRVTAMVVATYGVGALSAPTPRGGRVWLGLVGTTLVVAAANALNMWIERDSDGHMERTRDRPLPAGRLAASAALAFAAALAFGAFVPLLAAGPTLVLLGFGALVVYAGVYTPLKRFTTHALPLGAVAGAMPPLMGRVAATGAVDRHGLFLFALLFVWQIPHFHAISLVRADEYAAAGLVVGHEGRAGRPRALVAWCLVLVALSAVAPFLGAAPLAPALVGVAASAALLVAALRMTPTPQGARPVFLGTMIHLAVVLTAFALSRA
jgi:protoheme IX farnesyltransferase